VFKDASTGRALFTTKLLRPMHAARVVRAHYWHATDGLLLSACCDTITNCPFTIQSDITNGDPRAWQMGQFMCPQNTTQARLKCVHHLQWMDTGDVRVHIVVNIEWRVRHRQHSLVRLRRQQRRHIAATDVHVKCVPCTAIHVFM
jgi:hypothetical protein